MKETIFQGNDMVKTFGDITVLQGICLQLYKGDFTVVMGPSGSGKSTLLYALSGMDRLSGGQLFYRERHSDKIVDLVHASEKELTYLRAEEFGFVFQRAHLISSLTLEENIRMAGLLCGSLSEKEVIQKTDSMIRQMGLEKAKDRLPAQVSGGEAQRAAVARAVIATPNILFADEPTGALNKANTEEVLDIMTALYEAGQSILLVTHDREAALRGNRILYLEDGLIVGELSLGPYREKERERERKLASWLEEFRW